MKKNNPDLNKYRIRVGAYASDNSDGMTGAFHIQKQYKNGATSDLQVVSSGSVTDSTDEWDQWEHVSISLPKRCPNWEEMCFIKDMFWEEEETVIQFHPPKSQYVNRHPFTLHLWKNKKQEIQLPPSILVG